MMKRRGPSIAIIAVLVLGVLIFGGVYYLSTTVTDIFQPASAPPGKTTPLVIQSGESTLEIANDLQAKGLIRNALAFRIWARIKGLDTSLQAGVYKSLNTSMSISDVIGQLQNAQPDDLIARIPEGWRIEQIAKQFASAGLAKFNVDDFLRYTKHPNQFPDAAKYPILKSIPSGDGMEGLLFPDTYFIPVNGTARDVVNIVLTEFATKVQKYHLDTQAQQHHLTVYQMVILASLVEREVVFDADRPGVAGVYWNRVFKANDQTVGYLQSDPSVEYARDSQPGTQVYWKDLKDVGGNIAPGSLWNTYTHLGFPPTPLCSSSLASLQAAAAPPATNNYFFLGTKNGHIVYAQTYQQFLQEQQQYLNH